MSEENDSVWKENDNVSASRIDKDTDRRLRGDAIGDTLYSESFVLKTLMQFSDLNWTERFEEDLCFLWDMTLENDVCEYLFKVAYPSIACTAVCKYHSNSRFVEIVIGILANIFCSNCTKAISDEEVQTIINELESEDHLILIQVIRFIKAVSFTDLVNVSTFLTAEVMSQLCFILKNSINNDLIKTTLDTLSKITVDQKLDGGVISGEIVGSSIEAYKVLTKNITDKSSLNIEYEELRAPFNHLLEIIINTLSYVNELGESLLSEIKRHSPELLEILHQLLDHYSNEENLLSVPKDFTFHTNAIAFIFPEICGTYNSDVFINTLKMTCHLCKNENCEIDSCEEFICYLISVANEQQLANAIPFLDSDICKLLKKLSAADVSYEFDYKDKLKNFVSVIK